MRLVATINAPLTGASQDLGTRLDWVAVDHFSTGHPHSHVIIRRKDDLGKDLIIAREYLTQGLRERAAELVSIDLGPRTQAEILRSQLNEVDQERFTDIDRRLAKAVGEDGLVRPAHRDGTEQSLRAGRLQTLGRVGLAREVSRGAWKLDTELEPTLRRMARPATASAPCSGLPAMTGKRRKAVKVAFIRMIRAGAGRILKPQTCRGGRPYATASPCRAPYHRRGNITLARAERLRL